MHWKADLAWALGFPVAQGCGFVEWQERPGLAGAVTRRWKVDRPVLARAQATLTHLLRRFRHVLPELVGDVDAWEERLGWVLDRARAAVHDGHLVYRPAEGAGFQAGRNAAEAGAFGWAVNELPWQLLPRRARVAADRVWRSFPALRPVVYAAAWWEWSARGRSLLAWIDDEAEWLSTYMEIAGMPEGRDNVLLLGELARHDSDELVPVLRPILGCRPMFELPLGGFAIHVWRIMKCLKRRRPRRLLPAGTPVQETNDELRRDRNTPLLGPRVVAFVHWLASQDADVRRDAVRLATPALDESAIAAWCAAWETLDRDCWPELRSLLEHGRHAGRLSFDFRRERLLSRLQSLFDMTLPPLALEEDLSHVRSVAVGPAEVRTALTRTTASVMTTSEATAKAAECRTLQLDLLRQVAWGLEREFETRRLAHCVEAIGECYRRNAAARQGQSGSAPLPHWVLQGNRYSSFLWHFVQDAFPIERALDFLVALQRLANHPKFTVSSVATVRHLVECSASVDIVCQRFDELAAHDLLAEISVTAIRAAAGLACDGVEFLRLCRVLNGIHVADYENVDRIVEMHRAFEAAGWPTVVPRLLAEDESANVTAAAVRLATLSELKRPCSPPPFPARGEAPDWVHSWPAALQESLGRLAAAAPDAPRVAKKLLERHCPDPDKLDREIAALERRVAFAPRPEPLRKRLASLRERREQPRPLTGPVLERLQRQLDAAALRGVLASFRQSLDASLCECVRERLDCAEIRDRLSVPRHFELVTGLLKLNATYRELGLRLLRHGWGIAPWDRLAEPANRRFLDRLAARGVRVEPWLCPPSRQATDAAGQPIAIAFEEDAAERMLMGFYFGTCLSPRDFNFYSAVVNAADANKRVLYARDSQGIVVGRCLLAIGDAGTIVPFRPYCHDSSFPFAQHVAEIASQLAAAMGTVVSHTDRVSPLLAKEWYDDGAYDLALSIACDGSRVRTALKHATPATLLTDLAAALHPAPLSEATLAAVVELPELTEQPHLIGPLLTLLTRWETTLRRETLLRGADLARRAGCREFAERIVRRIGPAWLRRRLRTHGDFCCSDVVQPAFEALLAYAPSTALRVLHQSRRPGVHRDKDETDVVRRKYLAQAHRALGRSKIVVALQPKRRHAKSPAGSLQA